jgi:hypothetical protein
MSSWRMNPFAAGRPSASMSSTAQMAPAVVIWMALFTSPPTSWAKTLLT